MNEQELWIAFAIVFAALMLYDLLVVERRKVPATKRRALTDVLICVSAAVA